MELRAFPEWPWKTLSVISEAATTFGLATYQRVKLKLQATMTDVLEPQSQCQDNVVDTSLHALADRFEGRACPKVVIIPIHVHPNLGSHLSVRHIQELETQEKLSRAERVGDTPELPQISLASRASWLPFLNSYALLILSQAHRSSV